MESVKWLYSRIHYRQNIPCDMVSSRFSMNDWGPKQPIENEAVFELHLNFLQKLLDLGVEGFRFDAAKHIPPSHFQKLLSKLKFKGNRDDFIMYGEVLDSSIDMCYEYVNVGLKVVDYPLVFTLVDAFSFGKDIQTALRSTITYNHSICITDCHDSILGKSYKFSDGVNSVLAICYILARGEGIPLVYHSLSTDKHINAGTCFYQMMAGTSWHTSNCTENRLIVHRADLGFAVINKSGNWDTHKDIYLPGVRNGRWKELVYDFNIYIENGCIKKWGNNSGLDIGPRDVLFFVWID